MNADKQSEAIPSQAGREIESISAVTPATHDMSQAVKFCRALGFGVRYGCEGAAFTSFEAYLNYLNLISQPTWIRRVLPFVPVRFKKLELEGNDSGTEALARAYQEAAARVENDSKRTREASQLPSCLQRLALPWTVEQGSRFMRWRRNIGRAFRLAT